MRSRYWITGALFVALYAAIALAPLVVILISPTPGERRGFWKEFSVGVGFVGLAMMGLQFALTSRVKAIKAPFGSDIVYAFHRQISIVAYLLILAHVLVLLVLDPADILSRINPLNGRWPGIAGSGAVICLTALVVSSIWRKRLRINYDLWRTAHAIFGTTAMVAALVHVFLISHYVASPAKRAFWIAYAATFVALVVYYRLIKPWRELASPWEVVEVRPERGSAHTLSLKPVGHAGMEFEPGQFAWITINSNVFSNREHPFSISSSAQRRDRIEFTIRELGDFTRTIRDIPPGTRAYIDGPFGALSIDRHPHAQAFVLIAGGIGITPMMSTLRTMRDRGDARPVVLVYAANDPAGLTFFDEIQSLRDQMPALRVEYVLAKPPADWAGRRGFVTAELLTQIRPATAGVEYFLCGPPVMMDAVEKALASIGIPLGDYHSERFDLV